MAEEKKKSNKLKYILSFGFMLLLIAVTFIVIFKNNDMEQIWEVIVGNPNKALLLLSLVIVIGYLVSYALFAMIPLRARGEKTSFLNCFVYACTDFFYAAITPSAAGGEPMVIYTMSKDNIPFSHSSLTVVIQAMYNRAALLVYTLGAMLFAGRNIFGVSPWFDGLIVFGLFVNIAIVVFCSASMRFPGVILKLGSKLIRLLAKIKIFKKPEETLESFEKQVAEYKESSKFLSENKLYGVKMFLACFAQRGCMFFAAFLVYASFGHSELNFFQVMCIQAMVCTVVDNIPLPGAMGANELATNAIYTTMYSSSGEATAAMLLHRCITFYYPLIISGVVSLVKYLSMVMTKKNR